MATITSMTKQEKYTCHSMDNTKNKNCKKFHPRNNNSKKINKIDTHFNNDYDNNTYIIGSIEYIYNSGTQIRKFFCENIYSDIDESDFDDYQNTFTLF
jgi:hypothetical protein